MIPEYQIHELAEAFPPMEGSAFRALVEDIRKHKLLQPITLADGKVVDGRNRYRACQLLEEEGVEHGCFFEEFPDGTPREELVQLVVSRNFHRRHLTESQRAMVAARLAKEGVSMELAAEQMAVSQETVRKAATVLKSDQADDNVIHLIDRGKLSVHKASRYVAGEITRDELTAKRKTAEAFHQVEKRGRGRPAGSARLNTLLKALDTLAPLLGSPATDLVEIFPATHREQLVQASALLRELEGATHGQNRSRA